MDKRGGRDGFGSSDDLSGRPKRRSRRCVIGREKNMVCLAQALFCSMKCIKDGRGPPENGIIEKQGLLSDKRKNESFH